MHFKRKVIVFSSTWRFLLNLSIVAEAHATIQKNIASDSIYPMYAYIYIYTYTYLPVTELPKLRICTVGWYK